ncbi:MAG TPA: hypothetical protein VEC14_01085 [Reyranellaceae bacterium]|nr:hypothetical protein [Reyranellaceae bacterium]
MSVWTNLAKSVAVAPAKPALRTSAQLKFIQWVKQKHPQLYGAAVKRVGRPPVSVKLAGLGATTTPATATESSGWISQISKAIEQLGAAYLTVRGQYDLLKINKDRAQQGLDPITHAQAGVGVPVNVAADPGTVRAAGTALGLGISLPVAALGAFALWQFAGRGGGRRRRR